MVLSMGSYTSYTYIDLGDLRELRTSQIRGRYSNISCISSIFNYLPMKGVKIVKDNSLELFTAHFSAKKRG